MNYFEAPKMKRMESHESLEHLAQKNFDVWNESLQTKDPKKVAELYTDDNCFLPTLSPHVHDGCPGAEDYFAHFLLKHPSGEITESRVHALGENNYLHAGLYTFTVGDPENRSQVEARFTYVWQKINGTWKILHHHSSLKPQV